MLTHSLVENDAAQQEMQQRPAQEQAQALAQQAPVPQHMHGRSVQVYHTGNTGIVVDPNGAPLIMDGGGRVWTAPYRKLMAYDFNGMWLEFGAPPTMFVISKKTSESEDNYVHSGVTFMPFPVLPFAQWHHRIPNTNSFRECGGQVHYWKEADGSDPQSSGHEWSTSCATVFCSTRC